MVNSLRYWFLLLIFLFSQTRIYSQQEPRYYTVDDFKRVKKFDTHVHIYAKDESLIAQAIADNFILIDINGYLYPGSPPIEEQQAMAVQHVRDFPEGVRYVTTISVENFNEPHWQQETIQYLKRSFELGAVGVKVWKNIGMELKDKNGKIVMIDDPKFDPVLDFIGKNGVTLFSHQGEPRDCWLPLEDMVLHKGYYSRNPQYHMYLHPEYPTYQEQIDARDHMVAKHPDLKVVSVHLASLEWSVDEIAKRLDMYPNFSVDIAARIAHLQHQATVDWQKVRDFCIKYQDRILYGTDISVASDDIDPAAVKQNAHRKWMNDWKFFATEEQATSSQFGEYRGLHLPKEVIDKIYYQNARKWIPRVLDK